MSDPDFSCPDFRPALSPQMACHCPASHVSSPYMKVPVANEEGDSATREIIAGWIDPTSRFRCVGEYKNVTSALASLPTKSPYV